MEKVSELAMLPVREFSERAIVQRLGGDKHVES